MKRMARPMVVTVLPAVLAVALTACGEKKPPFFGAFMKDGSDFIELTQVEAFGVPKPGELERVPLAPDAQPVVILWQPNTVLQYLQLFSIESREEIRYTANPREDGILGLRPVDSLEPGQYCFIQGDPLEAFVPAWCFEVQ